MSDFTQTPCTAFEGKHLFARGPLHEIALAISRRRVAIPNDAPVQIFDDRSGHPIDIDTRGTPAEILQRLKRHPLAPASGSNAADSVPRTPGRPKLGVIAREVTMLPRHWEWLNAQPGGASVALRKLVDEARRSNQTKDQVRSAQEAAYRFMSSLAGNLAHYEEALRSLFANDLERFSSLISEWPQDIRDYALQLATPAAEPLQK